LTPPLTFTPTAHTLRKQNDCHCRRLATQRCTYPAIPPRSKASLFSYRKLTNLIWGQVIYTGIVSILMFMACLEWFLWLAAFLYCLVKVFGKAEHWSIRVLCLLIGSAFVLFRQVQSLP
jgi:hypothetical protein